MRVLPKEDDEKMQEGDQEEAGDVVDVTIKILKVNDAKYCVEFARNDGDQLIFFEAVS